MSKTFRVLQRSLKGWKIGYCAYPGEKTYWGLTFPTLPGAMGFIKKQSPGKLLVVINADSHPKDKYGADSDKYNFTW